MAVALLDEGWTPQQSSEEGRLGHRAANGLVGGARARSVDDEAGPADIVMLGSTSWTYVIASPIARSKGGGGWSVLHKARPEQTDLARLFMRCSHRRRKQTGTAGNARRAGDVETSTRVRGEKEREGGETERERDRERERGRDADSQSRQRSLI